MELRIKRVGGHLTKKAIAPVFLSDEERPRGSLRFAHGDPVNTHPNARQKALRCRVRGLAMVAIAALTSFMFAGAPRSTAGGPAFGAAAPREASPIIECSTYLGGSDQDQITDVALDADGYIYLTGWTQSPDFPTGSAHERSGT